jgi:type II secretory pathway component PulC
VAFSLLRASCPSPFGPASLFALLLQRSGDFLLAIQEKAIRAPKAHESFCFEVALK